jgi:hypothetical protein
MYIHILACDDEFEHSLGVRSTGTRQVNDGLDWMRAAVGMTSMHDMVPTPPAVGSKGGTVSTIYSPTASSAPGMSYTGDRQR